LKNTPYDTHTHAFHTHTHTTQNILMAILQVNCYGLERTSVTSPSAYAIIHIR